MHRVVHLFVGCRPWTVIRLQLAPCTADGDIVERSRYRIFAAAHVNLRVFFRLLRATKTRGVDAFCVVDLW